ncbi:MAG: hypothetical protein GWN14_27975, partial [candidate division Zixibacteria bacterium]|nr:hypothetical protein [candidate division Zixibacteria bacterium]NIX59658.1 hypothetical protein [candidate division Zixibacteria bacterium]
MALAQQFPDNQFADIQDLRKDQRFAGNEAGAYYDDGPAGSRDEQEDDPDPDDDQSECDNEKPL